MRRSATCHKRIRVLRHDQEEEGVWWYEVEDLSDYSFVRIPVVGSGIAEMIGVASGATNPPFPLEAQAQERRSERTFSRTSFTYQDC